MKLGPLLCSADGFIATRERILPDAFTDALYPSNAEAPLRPPAKWKVCCISIASLFLVVYPVSLHLPRVLHRMGVESEYAKTPILVAINEFVNIYALNPLLTRIVGHWLLEPRPDYIDTQPWKFLDQGFGTGRGSNWARLAFIFIFFYLPLLMLWADKERHF